MTERSGAWLTSETGKSDDVKFGTQHATAYESARA
jgi:hypothetical protein